MNLNEILLTRLRDIVGEPLYIEICKNLGGNDIHIPAFRGGFITKAERDAAIRNDFYGGMSRTALADKYDLSVNHICKITQQINRE